ncbi:hypothetical protein ACFS5M_05340 [Lacinutrix iliipiscaria]|uniref:Lipoprotein n=1 Tax=Lacinutrix iliipiscaria TaxID=1230532 RepID=A0ABW5WK73_9FLAO
MKRILFSVCFFALFFSCNSSDDNPLNQEPEANFYALAVGNAWVYKNYKYNTTTEAYDDTGVIDSVSIVGTEIISDHTYFKFRRWTTGNEANITFCNPNGEHFEWLRDSLGNLIDHNGAVKFTNSDFSERLVLENTWGNIYETLTTETTSLSVEAGEFSCINSERFARNEDGEQLPGLDRFYYADGIGLIHDTSSFVTSDRPSIKRRLDSYIIN